MIQLDGFNCGPLACMKMLQIFVDKDTFTGIDLGVVFECVGMILPVRKLKMIFSDR